MDLTVKKLKEAFGQDYPAINKLIEGRPDDFVFMSYDLLCRSDYIATKLWCFEDIEDVLKEYGYEGTPEQINGVIAAGNLDDVLSDCTDQDWECIYQACYLAGYPDKNRKHVNLESLAER